MPVDGAAVERGWLQRVAPLVEALDSGRRVGMVTDGDPSLYSTFAHAAAAVVAARPGTEVRVVPGVPSMCAAAAVEARALATGSDRLAVLPASRVGDADLEAAIAGADTVVLLKAGAAVPRLRRLLDGPARGWSVRYARRVGLEGEAHARLPRRGGRRLHGARRAPAAAVSREIEGGTVYVLGAGPGDPELLTVRARRVLEAAETVVYADSLVDPRLLEWVRPGAAVRGTSGMTLEPIVDLLVAAARRGEVVARVHSGDPGIYGAIAEQLARLDRAGVPWEVVPGVPSPMAAAAALGCELTVPGVAQAIVVCRVSGRTPMPPGQDLRALARPGVSLCILLSAAYAAEVVAALRDGGVDDATPAVIAERISWPDERVSWGTVGDLAARLRELGIRRQALLLVGPAFTPASDRLRSSLYSPEHAHVFRPAGAPDGGGGAPAGVAVYALTAAGAAVGARAAGALEGARLHLPARLAPAVPGARAEAGGARGVVARLVATHRAVVLVMATGAAVRLVAPHLADKLRDPAIVAVDDGGRWVVPLAGAHARGGNDLARRLAAALGAEAVVTTASDRRRLARPRRRGRRPRLACRGPPPPRRGHRGAPRR